ncbi:hypothetical protein C8Q78DRAFT_1005833 [Trametes maxima]|nr:hypothetical protein C8Q78DRAFT_1005833 [Trametes maxima]
MLRVRKRQFAVVLGALAHGDTLALDHALSAGFPLAQPGGVDFHRGGSGGGGGGGGGGGVPVKVHLSRRRTARLARAFRARKDTIVEGGGGEYDDREQAHAQRDEITTPAPPPKKAKPPQTTPAPLAAPARTRAPTSDFTFVCHSASECPPHLHPCHPPLCTSTDILTGLPTCAPQSLGPARRDEGGGRDPARPV